MRLSTDPKKLGFYMGMSQVGMEMVVPIVGGLALDHYLGWSPWGLIAGACLGFAGGLLHLLVMLKQHDEEERRSRREGS